MSKGSEEEKRRKAIITPDKYVKKVKSIQDKLMDVTVQADGSVTHNLLKNPKDGQPRVFKSEAVYQKWLAKHLRERKEQLK